MIAAVNRSVVQLLAQLRGLEVKLWAEGERLRFTAPEGALTPELKAELAERKAEVLGFLRQGQAGSLPAGPARMPPAAAASGQLPLSFAQQRLWFLNQLDPESSEYNIARAMRLSGPVRVDLLERSLAEVVRRHDVLRTTFFAADGQPFQRVVPEIDWRLPLVDLQGLPAEARWEEAQRRAAELARQLFDLRRGPLLRVALLRLRPDEHIAAATMHHIAGDGWSTNVLFREMGLLYESLVSRRPSPLPELPFQYADFAWWQRQYLQGEVLDRQLAYWTEQLRGAPEVLDLPADRPRSAVLSDRGARHTSLIPKRLADALKTLGQGEGGATLFMTLFAGFNALLHRCSGQEDVVVGFPVANRNWTEIEGLIGFFVNSLVLRTRMAGDPTVRELLAQVRQTTLGAYAHQDLPFERLVEELQPERRLSETPVFQVTIALANTPGSDQVSSSFRMSLLSPVEQHSQLDLSCAMKETPEGIQVSWRYRRDLFDPSTVARLADRYRLLLEGIVADPGQRLSELPLLLPAESFQLLNEWNGTPQGPSLRCLYYQLSAQAERTPEAPAVLCEDGTRLTYRELHARARRLARHLRRLGVGPDVAVGVCLERSPELIVSLLAVVEAGGAYLPLDPAYPMERLAYMLEDSGAAIVLTTLTVAGLASRLPEGVRLVDVADVPDEPPSGGPMRYSEALAWIIYTSGSTGRPKGVGVEQRAAAAHCKTVAALWRLEPGDRVPLLASPSFDASLEDILVPLTSGATVVILGSGPWTPADLLLRAVELDLTMLPLSTAYWHVWVQENRDAAVPPRLRLVTVGGEAMSPQAVRLWHRSPFAGVRLLNEYGPTEAVITPTVAEVDESVAELPGQVSVGRPLGGRFAYVLDRYGNLLPPGSPGELYLGGRILARGYVGRPDLTAERFVPDPFGEPGGRLYRTGDLARWRPDSGHLEFLGRLDQQVKVRGYRVEPEEIEEVLAGHPAVAQVVVVPRPDAAGNHLVAYVVARDGASPDLRSYLFARLPDYMVPAAVVALDALPLTPNGKVDRKVLPAPAPEAAWVAPRGPVEETLARIWSEVLNRGPVSVHANFFDLGGHSLLATQVISRVRDVLRVDLPLRVLFEAPTVAALAERVTERIAERRPAEPAPEADGLAATLAELERLPEEELLAMFEGRDR
ncbi:MAG TPA: amino acid adenylation domain-containing protein [Thermoanaerobaculia bacterium]|nr:amino acid adenylation domain-containing protein [Thermoanaerobaculia bacterium]